MTIADYDDTLKTLVSYMYKSSDFDDTAIAMAKLCLMDSMGCAVAAASDAGCSRLLSTNRFSLMQEGVPVIGSSTKLGPIEAAFHLGSQIRWLEFNDTWLAQEWGHPSDNLGAIFAAAAWRNLRHSPHNVEHVTIRDILPIIVRTYEVHGVLCLSNCFNVLGIDHVVLVKVASTLAASKLLGLSEIQALNALSNAIVDGHSLRTYRHAPNASPRKSWAAGDATARGIQLALFAESDEPGCPTAISTVKWGFNDSILRGSKLNILQPFQDFVVKNILFKVPNPAEYHAQTAVEAAIRIHGLFKEKSITIESIEEVVVETQRPAVQIIDKKGPLTNSADRDHCMQYMVAVALATGDLTTADFNEPRANSPCISNLRNKIRCIENPQFTESYYDSNKRAIPNALHVRCTGSNSSFSEVIEYPLGHAKRRDEAIPAIVSKFITNLSNSPLRERSEEIAHSFLTQDSLYNLSANKFLELFVNG